MEFTCVDLDGLSGILHTHTATIHPRLPLGRKENERPRYPPVGLALASLSDAKGPTGADQTVDITPARVFFNRTFDSL